MSIEQIVSILIQEREKLERAIAALSGGVKKRGRPRNDAAIEVGVRVPGVEPTKPKKHFSAARRRKMALAQKKRYAAMKAGKG